MKKILLIAAFALTALPTQASEVTGTLTTGIQTGIDAVVITIPSASPTPSVFASPVSVTLTAQGALSIHYTENDSVPTCTTGSTYSTPILVSTSRNIRALSCYANGISSNVISFAYAIGTPPVAPTTPPPATGGGGGGGGGGIVPPATPNPGDTNGDGKADVIDFNAVLFAWGATGSGIAADLNDDNVVDIFDFNILLINWSTS